TNVEGAACRKGRKRCGKRCIPKRSCCRKKCPGYGQKNTVVACVNNRCRLTRHFTTPGTYIFQVPRAGTLQVFASGGAGGAGGKGGSLFGVGGMGGRGANGIEVTTRFRVAARQAFTILVGGK